MTTVSSDCNEMIENFITQTMNEELKDSETKTVDEVIEKLLKLLGIATKLQRWCQKLFVSL